MYDSKYVAHNTVLIVFTDFWDMRRVDCLYPCNPTELCGNHLVVVE